MKAVYSLIVPALLVSGCATTPLEGLVTKADPKQWQVGFQRDFGSGKGYIREFVPRGENIKAWSKLLSIEFMEGEKTSATNFINTFATMRQSQCPGTKYELIGSDTYNAYYTFSFPACMGHQAQSEIGRIVQGNDGVHRLSYAVKGRELLADEKAEWLAFLRDAYVAKGDRNNRVR